MSTSRRSSRRGATAAAAAAAATPALDPHADPAAAAAATTDDDAAPIRSSAASALAQISGTDADLTDAGAAAAAPSVAVAAPPTPPSKGKKRRAPKRASKADADDESDGESATETAAAVAAAAPASSSSRPTRRRAAVRSYAEPSDHGSEDEQPAREEKSAMTGEEDETRATAADSSGARDEEEAAAEVEEVGEESEEDQEEQADAYEQSASSSDADADVADESADSDDEFVLSPVEKRRVKGKRKGKGKAAGQGAAKKASPRKTAAASTSKKKPTAAERKRAAAAASASPAASPLSIDDGDDDADVVVVDDAAERDRSFREFAARIDAPSRGKGKGKTKAAVTEPATAATAPGASSAGADASSAICIDDDVMEIEPFTPSAPKPPRNHAAAAPSAAAAAAAWSSIGLRAVAQPAALPGSGKGKGKKAPAAASFVASSKSGLSQPEKDRRLATLIEMLGHSESTSRATLVRYLEAASFNIDTAVCNIMDSAWFKSSHSADAAPAASMASDAHDSGAAQTIDISDGEQEHAAAAAAAAAPKRKLPSSGAAAGEGGKKARSASATGTLDSFTRSKPGELNDEDGLVDFLRPSAPAPVLPPWDRKLLLILNVSATSLTRGDALQVSDAIEFRREPFDLDAWIGEQRAAAEETKAASDAATNARSIAAASADGGKKKPAIARGKSKNASAAVAAAFVKKRAKRVLRFTKRGACSSHLELGSVPAILSDLLSPLLDSGCVALEGEILYLPAKLEPFDSITLSLSVFVLPALFLFRMPAGMDDASGGGGGGGLGAHPFWRKQNAAAALSWNPVAAFARLLKECDVRPMASTEMDIDQTAQHKTNNATAAADATDVEMIDEGDAAAGAAASSSAAAASAMTDAADGGSAVAAAAPAVAPSASAASASGVEEADAAPDNSEGATVSKFQLHALYASAAAVCASIPEADAPPGLKTTLRPYQRQALYWMMQRERGDAHEESQQSAANGDASPQRRRHALWDEYAFADEEETRFYLNPFSNECSLVFPESAGSCMGGILADEMGLGKTVECIALILANHPSNVLLDASENEQVKAEESETIHALVPGESKEEAESEEEGERKTAAAGTVSSATAASAADDTAAAASAPATAAPSSAPASSSSSFFDSVKSSRALHRRSYMYRNGKTGSTLVLVPMSLLSQWRDEIARFTDQLETLVYYGNSKDRRKVNFADYDVVLSSYGVVAAEHRALLQAQNAAAASAMAAGHAVAPMSQRQIAAISPLMATHFWRIMLDEGHIIRNRSTETAKAVFQLRADRRWVVSGTIIQNKLDDAFAALRFLGEEPWCSWGWWHSVISAPFERQDEVALHRLRAILTPLMLRRTKDMRTASGESMVELPPRIDETLVCVFSDKEAALYEAIYTRSKAQFDSFVASGAVMNKYVQVLTLLLRLRQCCDHAFLVLGRSRSDDEFAKDVDAFLHRFASRVDLDAPNAPSALYLTELASSLKRTDEEARECPICLSPAEIPVLSECGHLLCRECATPLFNERGFARCPTCRCVMSRDRLALVPAVTPAAQRIDPVANWTHSAKTARLLSELEAIRSGADPAAKSIIFSQWTSMLDLLEIPLQQAGFAFLRLDGSLSQKEREAVLKKYKNEPDVPVLLISLKAGGVGLNLVMANYCFFFDCWWNPSVEEQACQRVHRIGQQKTTYIKRFVVQGTVEERILQLQEKKKILAQSVSMTAEEQAKVRMQDLVDLFRS